MKKLFILFLAVITFAQVSICEARETKLQTQTATYYSDLQADLFSLPSEQQMPSVIIIHGGYWMRGDKKELSDFAAKLAENGYLVMNINYHLLPKYTQQAQTDDITNAIWWLRENSETLGINPSKIGVVGISSGGYLTAWAATHDSVNKNGTHSLPNAAVSLYGPWDLTKEAEKEIPEDSVKLVESFCAGQDRQIASPLYSISSSVPPVLLVHGDADKIVPVSQSLHAYQKLKEDHCDCKLVIVHKAGHCFPQTKSYFNAINMSVKFFNKVLK